MLLNPYLHGVVMNLMTLTSSNLKRVIYLSTVVLDMQKQRNVSICIGKKATTQFKNRKRESDSKETFSDFSVLPNLTFKCLISKNMDLLQEIVKKFYRRLPYKSRKKSV